MSSTQLRIKNRNTNKELLKKKKNLKKNKKKERRKRIAKAASDFECSMLTSFYIYFPFVIWRFLQPPFPARTPFGLTTWAILYNFSYLRIRFFPIPQPPPKSPNPLQFSWSFSLVCVFSKSILHWALNSRLQWPPTTSFLPLRSYPSSISLLIHLSPLNSTVFSPYLKWVVAFVGRQSAHGWSGGNRLRASQNSGSLRVSGHSYCNFFFGSSLLRITVFLRFVLFLLRNFNFGDDLYCHFGGLGFKWFNMIGYLFWLNEVSG